MSGCIYQFSYGKGFFISKVGRSKARWQSRLQTCYTWIPTPVMISGVWEVEDEVESESQAHSVLSEFLVEDRKEIFRQNPRFIFDKLCDLFGDPIHMSPAITKYDGAVKDSNKKSFEEMVFDDIVYLNNWLQDAVNFNCCWYLAVPIAKTIKARANEKLLLNALEEMLIAYNTSPKPKALITESVEIKPPKPAGSMINSMGTPVFFSMPRDGKYKLWKKLLKFRDFGVFLKICANLAIFTN